MGGSASIVILMAVLCVEERLGRVEYCNNDWNNSLTLIYF